MCWLLLEVPQLDPNGCHALLDLCTFLRISPLGQVAFLFLKLKLVASESLKLSGVLEGNRDDGAAVNGGDAVVDIKNDNIFGKNC